jgi:hypothetical protein
VGASEGLPWVFLGCLEGQRYTLAVEVNVENLNGNFLTNLNDLTWVVDVLPGELGNVDETVYAAKVNECTEVDDGGNNTWAYLTLLEGLEEGGANLGLGLLKPCAAGQNNVVAVLVELDDLGLDLLANVWHEVADTTHLHEGCWEEAAKTDVEDKTTLDNLDDGTGNDAVLFLDLLDGAPGALVLCALLGQDQTTFLVLLLENECLDGVAYVYDLAWVYIMLDGEFARWDDTFGLVADVEEYLVAVNLDNGALNDVAIVEVLDGCVNCSEEFFLGTNVVDSDLRGVVAH